MRSNKTVTINETDYQVKPWTLADRSYYSALVVKELDDRSMTCELIAKTVLAYACDAYGEPLYPCLDPRKPTKAELQKVWDADTLFIEQLFEAIVDYNKRPTLEDTKKTS